MKIYISCGTNYSNEPEDFHAFYSKEEADAFTNKKNGERINPNRDLYYETCGGELHELAEREK